MNPSESKRCYISERMALALSGCEHEHTEWTAHSPNVIKTVQNLGTVELYRSLQFAIWRYRTVTATH